MNQPTTTAGAPRPGTVLQYGRAKAYRPRSASERSAAFLEAVAAYERGDFFLTHELLEPAWMGTAEELERELYQGLIKLAAAFVHEVRGNREGVLKNLRGARLRLGRVVGSNGPTAGLDLAALVQDIDSLLETLHTSGGAVPAIDPPPLRRRPT